MFPYKQKSPKVFGADKIYQPKLQEFDISVQTVEWCNTEMEQNLWRFHEYKENWKDAGNFSSPIQVQP